MIRRTVHDENENGTEFFICIGSRYYTRINIGDRAIK